MPGEEFTTFGLYAVCPRMVRSVNLSLDSGRGIGNGGNRSAEKDPLSLRGRTVKDRRGKPVACCGGSDSNEKGNMLIGCK